MADQRLLIITPVRNEGAHIEHVAEALAAQTHSPERWLVVDDGSTDETPEILERLARRLEFMEVVATPSGFTPEATDRLAVAAAPRAFNYGLGMIDPSQFTHIGKLDGDIELRPDYYEAVLNEFDRDPRLGIAGGMILEQHDGGWAAMSCAPGHVRGALKLYTRECFEAIGGVTERLGWDGVDEMLARMRGYDTRSIERAEALHHRHTASADGRLRGYLRWGEGHWVLHHGAVWTAMRAAKVATDRPYGLSGAVYLFGYLRAALRGVPRIEVAGYRSFVRAEHRRRIREQLPIRSA